MASEDDKPIVSKKMDALRDKILWSDDALNVLLSLMGGEELSWSNRLPDLKDEEEDIKPYVWTAYFTVKDYMKNYVFSVTDAYIRDLIYKIAKQMSEDSEEGLAYAISSRSESSSSLSLSFMSSSGSGQPISEIERLLKSLDQFKKITTQSQKNRW